MIDYSSINCGAKFYKADLHIHSYGEDGSYDVYFGPKKPNNVPVENWVQTKPGMGWFVYLRLYGPKEPYFDKTWIPGDAEKVK